jgi:galactose oxidase-like protein
MGLWRGLGLLVCGAAVVLAQSPGTFTQTGDMSVPRQFHTATLLSNGKVLIAGGLGNGPETIWASAELYDPASGSFTPTGDMTTPRANHTATLLPNGKVLIAGGSPQASAELYDPASGTFSATGAPSNFHQTATLLNNGKVLVAGGPMQTAELYDPSTGTFSATGDMTEPGADTATLLTSGKVLITRSTQYFEESHADLYDPAAGTFTRTGDIIVTDAAQFPNTIPGQGPSAILLTNGRVLIAGGAQGDFWATGAQLYDPATGAFGITGKLTAGIGYWQAAALLPEGKVLIAGESPGIPCGITHIGPPIDATCPGAAELYDPVTGTFSAPVESLAQEGHAATLLPDGTVLLSGGFRCCGITIAGAEIYHPAVLLASPVLFSISGDGGPGAILHGSTHQIVSAEDPAVAGEAIEIYGSGLIDGAVIPPQVTIDGEMAEVLYFGVAPGYSGLNQINVRVPNGLASAATAPVHLNYLGRPSNEVTLAVR